MNRHITVVKIGGSILPNARAYQRAAIFLRSRLSAVPAERYVVVVSAQDGTTDELQREAQSIHGRPSQRMLDLLWATGELRSVAILTMHLHSLAVSATGLNVHEAGLKSTNSAPISTSVCFVTNGLRSALQQHAVVVVPGFFATDSDGSVVSLGRGGSDLTAVVLAVALKATSCELVKDVPGYFTTDPHLDTAARHIPALTFQRALKLADGGCDLVQRRAIEVASDADLPLVVRSLNEAAPKTIVSREALE